MSHSRKIYLSLNNTIYDFISYCLEHADGSFYITIQREGTNNEFIQFDSNNYQLKKIDVNEGKGKRKKISYHASGCVRYHNVHQSPNYFEPIINITHPNIIAAFIIPEFKELDIYNGKISDEDIIIVISDSIKTPCQFTFIIAPWNMQFEFPHASVRYKKLFSLIIQFSEPAIQIPPEAKDRFIFMTPEKGLFEQQVIDQHNSLILYHQRVNETKNMIIYSPNNEGVYKIIYSVPKRIAPELIIKFKDNSYSYDIISKTVSVVKFKVKDKYKQTIKKEVTILEIALDAEL